jgi:hypothetical protein
VKTLMFRVPCSRIAVLAIVSLGALLGAFAPGSTAYAFSDPAFYFKDTAGGGGGGRWFTGSPADGYSCDVCHKGGQSWPLYVAGLPPQGYVPGTEYDITLAWPEFVANAAAVVVAQPAAVPTMELIAELVAESGKGSGTIELLEVGFRSAAENCFPLAGAPATELWTVAPRYDVPQNKLLTCTADDLNERCLVATRGCGAQQVKMKWTSPSTWQGNIWFNAGFVASNDTTGYPERIDGVTELSIPLAAAASTSAGYVNRIESGCSVHRVGSFGSAGWLGLSCWLVVLRSLRRRRRERS